MTAQEAGRPYGGPADTAELIIRAARGEITTFGMYPLEGISYLHTCGRASAGFPELLVTVGRDGDWQAENYDCEWGYEMLETLHRAWGFVPHETGVPFGPAGRQWAFRALEATEELVPAVVAVYGRVPVWSVSPWGRWTRRPGRQVLS